MSIHQQEPTLDGWSYNGPDASDDSIPDTGAGIRPERGRHGKPVAYLRSTVEEREPITLLHQAVSAVDYRDKRVRFSAEILKVAKQGMGRLWLRVIPRGGAFNYAYGYADATAEWHRGEIVVDVDPRADAILFGVGVWEAGEVWVSDVRFEVVDESVPITSEPIRDLDLREPVNLTFEG